mmetsp:Transcript_144029/g.365598  ORF Transcript_144029/g.365598 Transcript_144029/m.365598 type:complete len:291 (-) Transcript_144029:463-1335(-)
MLHEAPQARSTRQEERDKHTSAETQADTAGRRLRRKLPTGERRIPTIGVHELLFVHPHGCERTRVLLWILHVAANGLRDIRGGLHVTPHLRFGPRQLQFGLLLQADGKLSCAREVGVRALMRICKVHPLREEASVQRHHAAMVVCHIFQLPYQCRGQASIRGCGPRRRGQDEANDLIRRGIRSLNTLLQLAHQVFAWVGAAILVEVRALDTIGVQVQVICDDDARLRGVRLIEHAHVPQVVDALLELPGAPIDRARIEVAEPHPTRAVELLRLEQVTSHLLAIRLLEASS